MEVGALLLQLGITGKLEHANQKEVYRLVFQICKNSIGQQLISILLLY